MTKTNTLLRGDGTRLVLGRKLTKAEKKFVKRAVTRAKIQAQQRAKG